MCDRNGEKSSLLNDQISAIKRGCCDSSVWYVYSIERQVAGQLIHTTGGILSTIYPQACVIKGNKGGAPDSKDAFVTWLRFPRQRRLNVMAKSDYRD
jgi:hypothetical protein